MILLYRFFHKNVFPVSLKDFSSSFVPDVAGVVWLSFIFLELEWRPISDVDFSLTDCFEFTKATYF